MVKEKLKIVTAETWKGSLKGENFLRSWKQEYQKDIYFWKDISIHWGILNFQILWGSYLQDLVDNNQILN